MKAINPALRFVLVFVGLYFILNVMYGLWISTFEHRADPLTTTITRQTSQVLNWAGDSTTWLPAEDKPTVGILQAGRRIISVYEGCNSLNVMIVFVAFVVAYKGKFRMAALFVPMGLLIIYLINILRIILLYTVALHWSAYFYYFHKYLFTAVIYAVVFLLWLWWMRLTSGFRLMDLLSANKS
ncbi:MAG: exosortase family protein XrtF [Cytophagales bacterium]|nr:exosortase family protein XrtF [Cytophagales bacterium]